MRRLVVLGLVVMFGIVACGGGGDTGPASSPTSGAGTAGANLGSPAAKISATGQLTFEPAMQQVHVGDVIMWSNTGTVTHTVTFDSEPSLSDLTLAPGGVWEVKFTKAGKYQYHCTIHPGMVGTIVVSGSTQTTGSGVTVGVATGSLGTFLVGPDGKALYLFEADTSTTSTCSGACAQGWPPLVTSGPPIAGTSVMQRLLSTSRRNDGTMEVVYNGHPLYYFSGDTKAGDTNGEGSKAFGAGWDLVSPAGAKIEKPGG
jgi:plastocyanin